MRIATFFRPRSQPSHRHPPQRRLGRSRLEDRCVPSANIDISHPPGTEAETNTALNPANPQTLVAVAIHAASNQAPPADTVYFSRDGGRTWGASSPLPL